MTQAAVNSDVFEAFTVIPPTAQIVTKHKTTGTLANFHPKRKALRKRDQFSPGGAGSVGRTNSESGTNLNSNVPIPG